jgi:hypothetical protein
MNSYATASKPSRPACKAAEQNSRNASSLYRTQFAFACTSTSHGCVISIKHEFGSRIDVPTAFALANTRDGGVHKLKELLALGLPQLDVAVACGARASRQTQRCTKHAHAIEPSLTILSAVTTQQQQQRERCCASIRRRRKYRQTQRARECSECDERRRYQTPCAPHSAARNAHRRRRRTALRPTLPPDSTQQR